VPLATWKDYARTRLLEAYAPYLDKAFVDARFAFIGTVLAGQQENRVRWKRGVQLVDQSMGEGLGKLYVATYFPPSSKARMEELVANLLAAYKDSITTIDWMSPATRKEALAKLAKFNAKIGYPKRWIDYRVLEIRRDDLVGNVMRARSFEDARQLAKLGKPIDRDEWGITPQTVNAYYNASMNEIVFPAAFMQSPNFNPVADDAVNYGAIGAVIGHEISHGFDDEGSQFDGDGNLRDWWTAEDRERFAAKTRALVAQYSAFVAAPPAYHVNGELTLGENIADNSGLAIAYKAYRLSLGGKPAPVIDGMSGDERFFYGYAQTWRGKLREEATIAQVKADPHAPDEFRVIGAARNHPAFYSTFGVKPGDKMYLPPAERVSIW
jgi:predicted metalloendopeptidase